MWAYNRGIRHGGAVVTRDVEPYMLVAGVPAKVVGKVDKEGNLR